LASPCFDLRFILVAARAAPGAEVAVLRRDGGVEGFLPFQRRGGLIQPLGAPLSDYHGLILRPGAEVCLAEVVERLNVRRFRFGGLIGAPPTEAEGETRPAMVADLSEGYEAYLESRRAAGHGGFLKDKRRRARLLEQHHGALTFSFDADPAVLDDIIAAKRAQMRRTAQHDVFDSAWTRRMMSDLAAAATPDFGLRFAVLRAGGRMIAAEVGLLSGAAYHLWLPVYEPEFARYSPGALMTLESLKALAEAGVVQADFGPAGEDYKRAFAEPAQLVFEGDLRTRTVMAPIRDAAGQLLRRAPAVYRPLRSARRRLERRIDRILACEPGFAGRLDAACRSLGRVGRRRPEIGIGIGVGAALTGLGVSLMD
jgi:CelD/BcsL family acetyltransferase involved in cellulose biosynthesis